MVTALTVICMLTGYTFCVPLKTETANEMIQIYVDKVYTKLQGFLKDLSDTGTEFKNQLYTETASQLEVEHKIYFPP